LDDQESEDTPIASVRRLICLSLDSWRGSTGTIGFDPRRASPRYRRTVRSGKIV
jgi:hypothetical protein